MSTTSLASITDEYLGRLDAAASRLPRDRRTELVTEVREHIDAAMAAGPGDEAALRTVLDHLGAPAEIARAAVEQEGLPLPGPTPDATNLRDISTVLLLMLGGFLLGAGWVLGVVLLWTSPRWRARDKLLATLVWPVGYAGVLMVPTTLFWGSTTIEECVIDVRAGVEHTTCTGGGPLPDWLHPVILLAVLFAQPLIAVHLLRRYRRLVAASART